MHDIVCFVFYQSSVLVIEVIIGDMSKKKKKKKKCVCVCVCVCSPVALTGHVVLVALLQSHVLQAVLADPQLPLLPVLLRIG